MKLQHTVAEVAALVGGRVEGCQDLMLEELRSVEGAGPRDLAAVFRAGAEGHARGSRAGCLLVDETLALDPPGPRQARIRVARPEAALDRIALSWGPAEPEPAPGVHPGAQVDGSARVHPDARIGALACVGARASIGAGSWLREGAVVEADAVVGRDCRLHAGSWLGWGCVLGERVVLMPGAKVGFEGFGFRQDESGRHERVPQRGNVIIGDDVEIGPNSTVARGRFDATVIGAGSKLDAQVHIGHNVLIGRDCAIAGNSALAGHVVLRDRVLIGGLAAVHGGIVLAEGTRLGGASVAHEDSLPGQILAGNPARPVQQWAREVASLRRLSEKKA